jgi:hypothetical protein
MTGDTVTEDKMQPNVNDRSEPAKSEPVDQQSQQSHANASAQPGQRASPGRKQLFCN